MRSVYLMVGAVMGSMLTRAHNDALQLFILVGIFVVLWIALYKDGLDPLNTTEPRHDP